MFKILKLFIFLFVLLINNNASAKPVPPGAGDGDEAANILFLVDSSASMGRWIGLMAWKSHRSIRLSRKNFNWSKCKKITWFCCKIYS